MFQDSYSKDYTRPDPTIPGVYVLTLVILVLAKDLIGWIKFFWEKLEIFDIDFLERKKLNYHFF